MGYKQEARENHVKKEDEEELRSQMEQMAREKCKDLASKLAECSYGGTKLFAWRCRQQIKEYGKCRHRFTNDDVLKELKRACSTNDDVLKEMKR